MAKMTTDIQRHHWAAVTRRIFNVPQLLTVRPRCLPHGETVRNMAPAKNAAGGNYDGK